MITMMNFGIPFKCFLFRFCHINDAYRYVLFLLEFPSPQSNTVVYIFKETKYLFWLIEIGTAVSWLNYHA